MKSDSPSPSFSCWENLSDLVHFVTPLFQAAEPLFDLVLALCAHHFRHPIYQVKQCELILSLFPAKMHQSHSFTLRLH